MYSCIVQYNDGRHFELLPLNVILRRNSWEAQYPLFTTVNRIVNGYLPPSAIVNYRQAALIPAPPLVVASDGMASSDESDGAASGGG